MRRYDYVYKGGFIEMPCRECGKTFGAQRRDASFCSPACRKKANRRKAKVQEAAQLVVDQLKFLQQTRDLRPDLHSDVRMALNTIKWQLNVTAGTSQNELQPEV